MIDFGRIRTNKPMATLFSPALLDDAQSTVPVLAPNFEKLLATPLLKVPLPEGFSVTDEAAHLHSLWIRTPKLHRYRFETFVHAGGSGMVFKVFRPDSSTPEALKIARKRLFQAAPGQVATALSPVSTQELRALEKLSHPHVVRLYNAIDSDNKVVAISTTFVRNPASLEKFLRDTFERNPDPKGTKGLHRFSPERLDNACAFLITRCQEVTAALEHMHAQKIYHFDIKPANILVDSDTKQAMLTDMGSCIHADEISTTKGIRVHFTWTYAHPDLTDITHDPGSLTGGGLKSSATLPERRPPDLAIYDLFALGKSIQECLAILDDEFGERCYGSYSFRYLHLIACLLLDGHNGAASSGTEFGVRKKHGRDFVSDVALKYPVAFFGEHRIRTAPELRERLSRFSRQYSWNDAIPELDPWQTDTINSGQSSVVPFTKRVQVLMNHAAVRRLKAEPQLGWIREVYSGATHSRWSHTLGVFASLCSMFNALLSDPEVPTFRIIVDQGDIRHAMVAAMLHDIGQSAFGHDFEAARPSLGHEMLVPRLLAETFGELPLKEVIARSWTGVDLKRVLSILRITVDGTRLLDNDHWERPVDAIAHDCINGPVDADKLDYLIRDSIACGVPYGRGMDPHRMMRALTVTARHRESGYRLALAYKAKGRSAIESMLMARYQMYGSVYWHHAYRCIQAMFTHAAIVAFSSLLNKRRVRDKDLIDIFYLRVICGRGWKDIGKLVAMPGVFSTAPDPEVASERALDFLWQFDNAASRNLIRRLASRHLFKRVFEMRLGELGERVDYSAMKAQFEPAKRVDLALRVQSALINSIDSGMRSRAHHTTVSENAARERLQDLRKMEMPLVVVDFPIRGLPSETNFPLEIGDPYRKYFMMPRQERSRADSVFHTMRKLQIENAAVRVFAAEELHELVIRYLNPEDIRASVAEALPSLAE